MDLLFLNGDVKMSKIRFYPQEAQHKRNVLTLRLVGWRNCDTLE